MRISDWSSDVCSSDLGSAIKRQQIFEKRSKFGLNVSKIPQFRPCKGMDFGQGESQSLSVKGKLITEGLEKLGPRQAGIFRKFIKQSWGIALTLKKRGSQPQKLFFVRWEEQREGKECAST